jgi:hypothetical protein
VVNEPRIILLIAPELLLPALSETTGDGETGNPSLTLPTREGKFVYPLNHGHLFAVRDIERVLGSEGGFGEREEINGVQHIRFALTVKADEAVEFGSKLKRGFAYVAIV